VSYPLAGRDELIQKIPSLRNKFPSYKDFGASRIEDIFPATDIRGAQVREAYTFASAVALNNGNGTFTLRALPPEAQFAPIYATLAGDFDGDGKVDLLVGGNLYGVTPMLGRYDASYGLLLRGDGKGGFTAVDLEQSDFVVDGQVRDIKSLRAANGTNLIVVARNNDKLMLFAPRAGAGAATQTGRGEKGAPAAPLPLPPAGQGARSKR
jgi:hypothetical protein